VVGIDFGENWISVDPKVDYDQTLARVQEVVEGYPGLRRDVQTYLKERIREVLTGGGEAIIVRLSGPDLQVLRDKAEEIRQAIAGVDGIVEDHIDLQKDIPQVDVQVDLAKARQHGIKPGDVRRAAATLMAGEEVGDIFRDGKAYDIQVRPRAPGRGRRRGHQADPQRHRARGRHPQDRRRSERPRPRPGRGHRRRRGPPGRRRAPPRLLLERQAATQRLRGYAVAAGIGVLLLLVLAFGSWRLGLMAFLALPMALVGGLIGAYLGGGIISLGSLVGFFTVLGIVARNGIMLITHCQHLEREEGEPFGPALVLPGATERLSPILMTALATALALVPLAVAGDLPGHEIEYPMAVVILGGLVTATLLNLFIVPSLYLRFGRGRGTTTAARSLPNGR
jgi:Cu/Ag efflux pump CusA